MLISCGKMWFWEPLSNSNGGQSGTQNLSNGAKTSKIELDWCSQDVFLKQHCARDAAWSTPGHINHYFWRNLAPFRPHFEWFSMTLGTASGIEFSYSPKAPHTRHNTEHLQRTCKKLLKTRTSKKLAPSKKLARNAKNLQRTSKKPAKQNTKSQTAYCILRRDSNRNKRRAS